MRYQREGKLHQVIVPLLIDHRLSRFNPEVGLVVVSNAGVVDGVGIVISLDNPQARVHQFLVGETNFAYGTLLTLSFEVNSFADFDYGHLERVVDLEPDGISVLLQIIVLDRVALENARFVLVIYVLLFVPSTHEALCIEVWDRMVVANLLIGRLGEHFFLKGLGFLLIQK